MLYKRQRNKCVSLRGKCIKTYFVDVTQNGVLNNKNFWKVIKPFLTNKGCIEGNDITLIENDKAITNDKELAEIFNNHYINIVEKTCNVKPNTLSNENMESPDTAIDAIIDNYKNHPSIVNIKEHINSINLSPLNMTLLSPFEVEKLLRTINVKKATGIDKIPPKLVNLSAEILSKPLTEAINNSLSKCIFPDDAKVAAVSPIDKKTENKQKISNYRPVSVLNTFSKLFETVFREKFNSAINHVLSPYLSAYRTNYSTQHVLVRLLEEWREKIDDNFLVGGILMDLSKAFDCIPHDLLLAKLAAYGVHRSTLKYIFSYLTNRKQCVKINNVKSQFKNIISGVPQGSIAGPILFNAFLNDFFYVFEKASVHNFADDNTLTSFAKTLKELISILETESNAAVQWFTNNKMIANPDKFQAIIIDRFRSDYGDEKININKESIKIVSSVKLLGVQIDNQLNFNLHISSICKSAANQLSALLRLKSFLGFDEKKILVNSFILSNFNYCPLVWFISSSRSLQKIENLQKRALRFLYNDYSSPYEVLLDRADKVAIKMRNHRVLCIEIFKTLNDLNPSFMKTLFQLKITSRPIRKSYQLNLNIPITNRVRFGTYSLRNLGPKIWNALPYGIKSAENLEIFKDLIKTWNFDACQCKLCNR